MLKLTPSPHLKPEAVSDTARAELLNALSQEASHLKDEARVLLKRRRELIIWRNSLLRDH